MYSLFRIHSRTKGPWRSASEYKTMILKIDSTNTDEITVDLVSPDKKIHKKLTAKGEKGSQVLLPLIVKILKDNKKNFGDIKEVIVNVGPGSFTGTRVGVSIANAIGYALGIPVNGKKGKIALPKYTKSKFD